MAKDPFQSTVDPSLSEHQLFLPDDAPKKEKNVFLKVAGYIKSVDGIDETGNLLAVTLPGIGGPIAASLVVGLASPFVFLGILGMKEEYEEACKELDEILKKEKATEADLHKLAELSDKARKIINEKCGLGLPEKTFTTTEGISASNIPALADAIAKHQQLQNEKLIATVGKKYGWTGIVGMAAMFGGMVASTGSSIADAVAKSLDIAAQSANAGTASAGATTAKAAGVATAEIVGTGLETASGGLFLVGQVAMSAYAGYKIYVGTKKINSLQKSRKVLQVYWDGSLDKTELDGFITHVDSIFRKEKHFIQKNHIRYGWTTIAGQTFMFVGTVSALSGLGLPATLPLYGIGAPLTIGSAIYRILNDLKEERFKGKMSGYVTTRLEGRDPLTLMSNYIDSGNCYKEAVKDLKEDFLESTGQLALIKCLSLLHHAVNDRAYKDKTGFDRFHKIEKLMRSSGKMKGSEIETPTSKKVQEFLTNEDNQCKIKRLLAIAAESKEGKNKVNALLTSCVAECLKGKAPDKILEGVIDNNGNIIESKKQHTDNKKFLIDAKMGFQPSEVHSEKYISTRIKRLNKGDVDFTDKDKQRNLSTELRKDSGEAITRAKNALKAIRFTQSHQIVNAMHIEKMAEGIRADLGLEQPEHLKRKPFHQDLEMETLSSTEESTQPPSPKSKPSSRTTDNSYIPDNVPIPYAMHGNAMQDIETFKEDITQTYQEKCNNTPIPHEKLTQQQKTINQFQQQFTKFVPGDTTQRDGKIYYQWKDPRPGYQDNRDYDILYIKDIATNKMDVLYGSKAYGLIFANPDMAQQTGARVFTISEGVCTSSGDETNTIFNLPQPKKHVDNVETDIQSPLFQERQSISRTPSRQNILSSGCRQNFVSNTANQNLNTQSIQTVF